MHLVGSYSLKAMSMPYGVRSSCRNDYLLCVWSSAREAQRRNAAVIHTPAPLAATLNCLAGKSGSTEPLWPRADLKHQLRKTSLLARRPTQWRRSNKQSLVSCANF